MGRETVTTIKKRSDFLAANGGKKFVTSSLILQMNTRKPGHPAGEPPRIGYTVTKKMGNAVARNRIKRRLREAMRRLPPAHLVAGHDFVIISRIKALDCDFSELLRDMEFAFSRITANKNVPDNKVSQKLPQ